MLKRTPRSAPKPAIPTNDAYDLPLESVERAVLLALDLIKPNPEQREKALTDVAVHPGDLANPADRARARNVQA
jgi:hypothetical protein